MPQRGRFLGALPHLAEALEFSARPKRVGVTMAGGQDREVVKGQEVWSDA